MRLVQIVEASRRVSQAKGRLEKIDHLAHCLRRAEPDAVEIAVAFLSGALRQGRVGIGPAALREAVPESAARAAELSLREVDERLAELARTSGPGAGTERLRRLSDLLGRATLEEREFLVRLLVGELRQGALEGLMLEAIARAAEVPVADVRRAFMLEGDLGRVASAAKSGGSAELGRFRIRLFRPLQPMLASPAQDVEGALTQLGEAAFEWKLDGARVQVHKSGGDVRVFTRRLNDVTAAVPEIAAAVRDLPAGELILDGEALALRSDGRPHAFQTTMRRFGRKLDVAELSARLPLRCYFFDCLRLEGDDLIDRPGSERCGALAIALPAELRIPRTVSGRAERVEPFLQEALRRGHEGLMAKSLGATYAAGSRGSDWLKLKPAHTLDLVVLAAEWGHGRRRGRLSNLHLAARDAASGQFVMLGKTFKGMTDEVLIWQTRRLLELETARDAYVVYVRPELVVEVAVGGVQASPQYPAGLALRFARLKRYRPDKKAEEADTIEHVRAIHEGRASL